MAHMKRPVAVQGSLMAATVAAKLDKHTIVWGDNDGGKNRFTRILELALTAGVDDIQGRGTASPKGDPVRLVSDLAILGNPDGTIRAHVTLADEAGEGSTATWSMSAGGKVDWQLPDELLVERTRGREAPWWAYPVRTVYAWITGGAEAARVALLPFIVPPETLRAALDLEERSGDIVVSPSLRARLTAALPGRPIAGVDDVLGLLEQLRDEADRAKAAAAARQTAIQEQRRAIDRDETPQATLAALEAAARAATAAKEQATKVTVCGPLVTELRQLQDTLKAGEQYVEQYTLWLGYRPTEPVFSNPDVQGEQARASAVRAHAALASAAASATELAKQHGPGLQEAFARLGVSFCPCCGSRGTVSDRVDVSAALAWLTQQTQPSPAAAEAYARWRQAHTQWREVAAQWDEHNRVIREAAKQVIASRARYDYLLGHLRTILGALWDPSVALPSEVGAGVDEQAVVAYETARAANARWEQYRAAERAAKEADAALEGRIRLITDTQNMVETLLRTCIGSFENDISAYLPEGTRAEIRLEDAEGTKKGGPPRRLFRMYLRRGGRVETACGGAFSALLLATTTVVLQRLPVQPTATMLALPEDRGWSPRGLATYLPPLAKSPYPILITSNVQPPDELRQCGWGIIPVKDVTTYGVYTVEAGASQQQAGQGTTDGRAPRRRGGRTSPGEVRTRGQAATVPTDAAAGRHVESAPSAPVGGGGPTTVGVPPVAEPGAPTAPADGASFLTLLRETVDARFATQAPPQGGDATVVRDQQDRAALTARGFLPAHVDLILKNPAARHRVLTQPAIRPISAGGLFVVTASGDVQEIPPIETASA